MNATMFSLNPVPPFRLDLTAWALRRRPDNVIDRWDAATYGRVLAIEGHAVQVAVEQGCSENIPELRVIATGDRGTPADVESKVTKTLERVLGLKVDLTEFYRLADHDARLLELTRRFRGVKPPRFPTIFEALVNGIACQQVTLTLGIRFLNRLAEAYGACAAREQDAVSFAFPAPEALATRDPEDLRRLGFSGQKARAIVEAASAAARGYLDLEGLSTLDNQEAVARLCQLRGVGRWTAEYILLRGLGRLDVFPGDDVGARNNLSRWLGLSQPPNYDDVRRLVEPFEPYAGLVYFHLLLNNLARAGYLAQGEAAA